MSNLSGRGYWYSRTTLLLFRSALGTRHSAIIGEYRIADQGPGVEPSNRIWWHDIGKACCVGIQEEAVVAKKISARKPLAANPGAGAKNICEPGTPPRVDRSAGKQPRFASVEALMHYAYAMEAEAAERYAEFAGSMESHNNHEVAELFRKLARIELQHCRQILESMNWTNAPTAPGGAWRWQETEHAETADSGQLHYLMHPYHALKIALENELRAQKFFANVVRTTTSAAVRATAVQMEREEAEHVQLIENWLKRTAVPDPDWAQDADPPRNYD